jgi:transcriptional antiterminator NusG
MIEKKLYPGYVFVKSVMNDKVWYVIRNTPWVRIIVGAETRPIPLTEKEFTDMVKQVEQRNTRADLVVPYRVWDIVMLKDGSFSWTKWVVHEIDAEKMHLVVNIEILGRLTPVVTELDKVELSK